MRLITKSGVRMTTIESPTNPALGPELYDDLAVLHAEHETIFARTWQLGGHVSEVAEPGRFLTVRVGEESVLVVRGEDGELRAFRNVCRHRAARLREGRGDCGKAIRCPLPRLDLPDGRLAHRRARGAQLPRPGQGAARPPARPGGGVLRPALRQPRPRRAARRRGAGGPRGAPRALPHREPAPLSEAHTAQPANWKIVAENYLEGYHVPIAHPGLMRLLDYQRYSVEVGEGYVYFDAPMRDKPSGNRLERAYQRLVQPMPGLTDADRRVWRFVFIWPNTTLDLTPTR